MSIDHDKLKELFRDAEADGDPETRAAVDRLLNSCDQHGGECTECSGIICPYGDRLHFHHDGCPSCSEHE